MERLELEKLRDAALQKYPENTAIKAAATVEDLNVAIQIAADFDRFQDMSSLTPYQRPAPHKVQPVEQPVEYAKLIRPVAAVAAVMGVTWGALEIGSAIVAAIVAEIALVQRVVAIGAGGIIVVMVLVAAKPRRRNRPERPTTGEGNKTVIVNNYINIQ